MRVLSLFIFGTFAAFLSTVAQQRPEPPTMRPQPPVVVSPETPPKADTKEPRGKQAANLRWQDPNVPPADSFSIYRADGECRMYLELSLIRAGVKGLTYVDSTIRPNRTYCYAVSATYQGIESAQSGPVTATPPKK